MKTEAYTFLHECMAKAGIAPRVVDCGAGFRIYTHPKTVVEDIHSDLAFVYEMLTTIKIALESKPSIETLKSIEEYTSWAISSLRDMQEGVRFHGGTLELREAS